MQERLTSIIGNIAKSNGEMARILEAKRHSILSTAQLIVSIPSEQMTFPSVKATTKNAMAVTKSVTSYLMSLAELQDAIADNLKLVVSELDSDEEE